MKQTLVLCTLILTLSGCATVSDLPPGYSLSRQDGEGLAVVSLTLSGKDLDRVSSFEYRVREAATASGEEVKRSPYFHSAQQMARWVSDRDEHAPATRRVKLIVKDQALVEPLDVVESGKAVGRLAMLRLPVGDYELYDWKVVVPNQYGGDELGPRRAVGYRFTIEAGRATYLGNVDLHMTEQDTYDLTVDNKAERDLALLAKKLPSMRTQDVIYRLGEMPR